MRERMHRAWLCAWLCPWLAGCPLQPDFASDAGPGAPDAGVFDAGATVDAGVDAGASGDLSATLSTSNGVSTPALAWNGGDLANSTLDSPSQVTLFASNPVAGQFKMTLGGLTAGSTTGQVLQVSYQPASGPDGWTCTGAVGNTCTLAVTLSNYDGLNVAGTFSINFPIDVEGNSAALSNGAFNVTLP